MSYAFVYRQISTYSEWKPKQIARSSTLSVNNIDLELSIPLQTNRDQLTFYVRDTQSYQVMNISIFHT